MGSTPIPGTYSASMIGGVLGLSPYTTQLEIWQKIQEQRSPGFNKKHGYELPVFIGNASTRFGLGFEDAITKLVEEKYNTEIVDREKSFTKKIGDVTLSCHVDGIFKDENILNENKTTNERAFYSVKDDKARWGEELTDEIPPEYQAQCATQMLCAGMDEVRMHTFIFPKPADDFEEMGWTIEKVAPENLDAYQSQYMMKIKDGLQSPICWARTLEEMGYLKSYTTKRNEKLETAIIEAVTDFHNRFVVTEIAPRFMDYKDVRRLMTQPMGTVIATPEMVLLAKEYSHLRDILGSKSPHKKRQEIIKVELLNLINANRKEDWSVPSDKVVIVDPNGGNSLISYSSKGGFRAGKV